jgi:hypothetical protein
MNEIQDTPSPGRRVDGGDSRDGETSGYSIPDLPEVCYLNKYQDVLVLQFGHGHAVLK